MEGVFISQDLGVAAFLVAKGYTLVEIRRVPGSHRSQFVFPSEARDIAEDYFNGALVQAHRLTHAMRDLKLRLHTRR